MINDTKLTNDIFSDNDKIQSLRNKFKKYGYVKLNSFFTEEIFSKFNHEIEKLYKSRIQRDFMMPSYDTPRTLSVLGGKTISENSEFLPDIYNDSRLSDLLSSISGTDVFRILHPEESMVVNFIEKQGGTHGWHLDDPKYALVIIMKSPESSDGGYLEMIPNYKQFAEEKNLHPINDTNKLVAMANDEGLIRKITHETGECYLLNAADSLHRVSPVNKDTNRIVINFAFDDRLNVEYGNTADMLYSESSRAGEM